MSKGIAGYPMGGHTSMSLPFGTHSPTICLWVSFGWEFLDFVSLPSIEGNVVFYTFISA